MDIHDNIGFVAIEKHDWFVISGQQQIMPIITTLPTNLHLMYG